MKEKRLSVTKRFRSLDEAQEWVGLTEERCTVVHVSYSEDRSYPGALSVKITYVVAW